RPLATSPPTLARNPTRPPALPSNSLMVVSSQRAQTCRAEAAIDRSRQYRLCKTRSAVDRIVAARLEPSHGTRALLERSTPTGSDIRFGLSPSLPDGFNLFCAAQARRCDSTKLFPGPASKNNS